MNKIQLYSLGTPNGIKVSVALEEMEIPYEAHRVDIMKGDQFKPEFLAINPNSKIPAILDPVGDHGKPLCVFESGAILVYLAEKSGKFLSPEPTQRIQTLQWLFFQMAGVGPMFGQFGHFFKYAKDKCKDPYPVERYTNETKRLLGVMDRQLSHSAFLAGDDYSIADMATAPWVITLERFYEANEALDLDSFKNVDRWLQSFLDRPKVQKGLQVLSV